MADSIEFYNVKKKAKVQVAAANIQKTKYVKETAKGVQERYALKAVDDGTKLTKFVSKADWDALSAPIV